MAIVLRLTPAQITHQIKQRGRREKRCLTIGSLLIIQRYWERCPCPRDRNQAAIIKGGQGPWLALTPEDAAEAT